MVDEQAFSLSTFSAASLALLTVYVSLDRKVFLDAVVKLVQRDSELKLVFGPFHSIAATPLIPINLVLALLIIYLPLCIISQYLERSVESRELLCSVLITFSKV